MKFYQKQESEQVPVDISSGSFTAPQLAARAAAREKAHNDLIVAAHDSDRDLGNQTADCRSNHQTSAGKPTYAPKDSGIVPCKLDPIDAGTVTNFPEAFGGLIADLVKIVQANSRSSANEK